MKETENVEVKEFIDDFEFVEKEKKFSKNRNFLDI